MSQVTESKYPITFRGEDAQILGQHLRQHNSVALIGMKRVGIGNFLRFFLNHSAISSTYIQNGQHVFVVVDLNNLVEKTLYAFWMLTLKRIVDVIETSQLSDEIKEQSRATFTQSIQLGDSFFTLESVHKLIKLLTLQDIFITVFFLRFDRLQDVITPEFFANIQGLREVGNHLSYVFTSYRSLYEIVPTVFTRSSLSGFCEEMYLKPAANKDMKIILSSFQERYGLELLPNTVDKILKLAGGHVQYLHLILIKLKNEQLNASILESEKSLQDVLDLDEEIRFLSEELFASLSPTEQEVLMEVTQEPATANQLLQAKYLWDTGLLPTPHSSSVFSPLFQSYLHEVTKIKQQRTHDFTKKEHLLFTLLQTHETELVEREMIIEQVWPDEIEFGVSDWSIDRLVSRVRSKLKAQNSEYKIVTVITRGYKLVKKN